MRTRLLHLWETVSSGYWFVPAVMMVVASGIAFLLLYLDRTVFSASGYSAGWLYSGGFEGAKTLLSVVAGSVVTVAGVVFSITVAALSQASSQFGPRLLRNFMKDTGNQITLGTFVATFLYCLLVLRTLHGKLEDNGAFVPQASVTFAVALAVSSIAVLIYFIHHVSVLLQAPTVVATVADDLERVVRRLARDQGGAVPRGDDHNSGGLAGDFDDRAAPVAARFSGYVQAISFQGLVALAREHDLVLRLRYRPGDYVIRESVLAEVSPAERAEQVAQAVNAAFIVGRRATPEQDVEHSVRQLVEIAVRALSPGINDPFTAIACVNALGSGVCLVARSGLPGGLQYDDRNALRLVVPVSSFEGIVNMAFDQIRQYGRASVAVTIRLLEVLVECIKQAPTPQQKAVLLRHAQMVYADSAGLLVSAWDRKDVHARWEAVIAALSGGVASHVRAGAA